MVESIGKIPGLAELIRNQDAYEKQRVTLEQEHNGKVALFSEGELKELFENEVEAYRSGFANYGEGNFFLHEIGASPKSCGSARPYTLKEMQEDGLV